MKIVQHPESNVKIRKTSMTENDQFTSFVLNIWKRILLFAKNGAPLPWPDLEFPMSSITLISDAAGGSYTWSDNRKNLKKDCHTRGAASILYCHTKILKVCSITN